MDQLVGRTLGPYDLQGRLGAGGMGVVYRAVHRRLRQPRAVKVLPAQLAANPEFVERFEREARFAAELRHPHIVPVYDVGDHDGVHYIAMELLAGRSLRTVVQDDSPIPLDRAARLLRQLAEALDFAHANGVAHRDVKPGNVFLRHDDHLTLVDFGIAHAASEARLTGTGAIVGTAEYLAPEVIMGAEHGAASDLYAFGIVAYELLTGRLPFTGANSQVVMFAQVHREPPRPRDLRPDLPDVVERLLLRQLAKTPEHRFATATAFVSALEASLAGIGETKRLDHPEPAPVPPPRIDTRPILGDDLGDNSTAGARTPGVDETRPAPDALRARTRIAPPPPQRQDIRQDRARTGDPETDARFPRRQALIALGAVVVAGGGLLAYGMLPQERPSANQPAQPTPGASQPPPSATVSTAPAASPAPPASPLPPAVTLRATLVGTIQKVSDTFDIVGMRFTPDGQTLVVVTQRHVSVWKVADRTKQREWAVQGGRVDCMALTPDGVYVAAGTATNDVFIMQTADDRQFNSLAGHSKGIRHLAFSLDGMILASASNDATVRLWQTVDGRSLQTLQIPSRTATAVAFARDGSIAVGAYGLASLWSGPGFHQTQNLDGSTVHEVTAIAFSPDGALVAVGWSDDTVRVSRVADGSLLYELADPPGSTSTTITDIVFTPDGRLVLAGRMSVHRVSAWSLADGKLAGQIVPSQTDFFLGTALSPSTNLLAMGNRVGGARNIELLSLA